MLHKKHITGSDSIPGSVRPGMSPQHRAKRCTIVPKPVAIMNPATVIDSVFSRNSFTQQEQKLILLTIDQHTDRRLVAKCWPAWQNTEKLPHFITEAIRKNKPIEIEKLQALRKFTTEILDLQQWITEEMVNEYLAAGYSKLSIMDLKALARLVVNHQQRRDRPCSLHELPCIKATTEIKTLKPTFNKDK